MKKLDELRQIIEKGKFPRQFPEFAGANLIITKNKDRNFDESDILVYSENASALSWLVVELKKIYDSEIDYINKYDFYPSIGKLINRYMTNEGHLFDVMLLIIDEIEHEWGTK